MIKMPSFTHYKKYVLDFTEIILNFLKHKISK